MSACGARKNYNRLDLLLSRLIKKTYQYKTAKENRLGHLILIERLLCYIRLQVYI